mgnify:CR=1 FL=1
MKETKKFMESRLFQALKAFKGTEGCEANLFEEFKKIAEAAFFSGYFLINGDSKDAYRLKLTCIEFYYHEDDGYIKDKIKYLKGKDEFGYAIEPGKKEWENNEKRKDWAPHDFWYDFFGGANMLNNGKFNIEWIDEPDETPGYAEPMKRINIDDNRLWGFKRVEKL